MAALFSVWGQTKTQAFLNDLVKTNQVRIASSNGDVKRFISTGEVVFGVADTDDAHGVIEEKAPIDAVYPDQDDVGTLVFFWRSAGSTYWGAGVGGCRVNFAPSVQRIRRDRGAVFGSEPDRDIARPRLELRHPLDHVRREEGWVT